MCWRTRRPSSSATAHRNSAKCRGCLARGSAASISSASATRAVSPGYTKASAGDVRLIARGKKTMRPKRVLILVENLLSPFDRRVWQEANALRGAGVEVSIICPTGRGYERKFEEI